MTRGPVERLVDVATAYLLDPPRGDDPVIVHASPAELFDRFEAVVPLAIGTDQAPVADDRLIAVAELVVEHSVHTSHPRFMNQNFAGPDPIAVAGDWLAAALNTTGATFEAAPVFTLMESAVLTKLAKVAGMVDAASEDVPALPPGLFCPGGSTATLYALQLARHRRQPDLVSGGASSEQLALFVSEAGHYAAAKSAALLGIGTDGVISVPGDAEGAIDPDALRTAIGDVARAGRTPFAVIGTSGTTVTSAFDDLDALADICDEHELWLHVDGCYGGSALFSPTERHRLAGVERAHSMVWNLHKMMGMTQQCTALLVADPSQLAACFSGQADYLFQPDKLYADYDNGDRTFQCARRVDVLKAWLAWKAYGDAGFARRVDHAVAMAAHARHRVLDASSPFAFTAGTFTNVVFGWVPPGLRPFDLTPAAIDALPAEQHSRLHNLPPAIKARMQAEGTAMLGFQPIRGLNTFRLLVMNPEVGAEDIDAVLDLIDRYGTDIS